MNIPMFGGGGQPQAPSVTKTVQPIDMQPGRNTKSDITGKFDPTALERGAAALKILDQSTNSQKAFEITKLQELTRQKELEKETEQIHAARMQYASEKSRIEGEEQRKTLTARQEQERMTAKYRAQLDAEAYQKKLQEQQQQNETWLQQQHQQFLRQEEQRKRTEAEILEMRRKQIREEKAMEKDLMQARIKEETKGRIMQERENVDIHLRSLRAKSAEDRKTKLETLQQVFSGIGNAGSYFIEDRMKLATMVGGITGIAAGIYGARVGTRIFGRYVESKMGKPPLVRETSRWHFKRGFLNNLFPSRMEAKKFQENIVLEKELSERLTWSTNSLMTAKKNGTSLRHICLSGPPGTGKTLFARTLARQSNMDYAIMSGGDVGPLGNAAVTEINKLFAWANRSRRGMILFIDEADAFLRMGRGLTHGMSEDMRNALSAFLHQTGTESDKFCVVLATNCREIIDRAVLDRIDEHFIFPLPGFDERLRMARMFLSKYITSPTPTGYSIMATDDIDESFLETLATKTEGFSGRQVAKLFISMQAAVLGSGSNALTRGLAETVLKWKLEHFEEDMDTIDNQTQKKEREHFLSAPRPKN